MKFTALLKKELRICLPWLLLCILVFGLFGSLLIKGTVLNQKHYLDRGYQENHPYYNYVPHTPIYEMGPLILIVALALGVILAAVQFFLPGVFRTWAFTLHRSVKPQMILWSKFTAAGLTFVLSLGLLWTLLYQYAAVLGRFYLPVFFRTYLEGWIYILAGLIIYWGTTLSAISTTHLYTTRLLGLVVATGVISLMLLQTTITGAIIAAAVGAIILIVQIFHTFLAREF
jgi:hypothetical protein